MEQTPAAQEWLPRKMSRMWTAASSSFAVACVEKPKREWILITPRFSKIWCMSLRHACILGGCLELVIPILTLFMNLVLSAEPTDLYYMMFYGRLAL